MTGLGLIPRLGIVVVEAAAVEIGVAVVAVVAFAAGLR